MKKKMIILVIILLLIFPISINANIICNDGTISNSCQDCHKGCCSRHGGCTNNPNSKSNNKKNKTKKSKSKTSSNSKKTSNTNQDENKEIISNEVVKGNNTNNEAEDSSADGIIGLLAVGATIYGVKKAKGNKKR